LTCERGHTAEKKKTKARTHATGDVLGCSKEHHQHSRAAHSLSKWEGLICCSFRFSVY
jgi:hypothetical protein